MEWDQAKYEEAAALYDQKRFSAAAEKFVAIIDEVDDPCYKLAVSYSLVNCFAELDDVQAVIRVLDHAEQIPCEDEALKLQILFHRASVHLYLSEFPEAIEQFTKFIDRILSLKNLGSEYEFVVEEAKRRRETALLHFRSSSSSKH